MPIPFLEMTWLDNVLPALGWMLVHSIWQGILLSVATGIIMIATRNSKAAVRYNLVFIQFLLFVVAVVATFLYELTHNNAPAAVGLSPVGTIATVLPVSDFSSLLQNCNHFLTAYTPLIVLVWMVCFIARSIRLISGMVYLHQQRSHNLHTPDAYWEQRLQTLSRQLHLKKAVAMFESGCLKVPVVVGNLKPVILMPLGLLTNLPAAQVEAVLLHELAHIRRNDYLVNIFQHIIEAVFFFNPGLLWISALLKEERENCCDDMAIEQTGNKRAFVQALISFKQYALGKDTSAVAFPGKRKSHLLQRAARIVNNQNKKLSLKEGVALLLSGVVLLMAMTLCTIAAAQQDTAVQHNPAAYGMNADLDDAQKAADLLQKKADKELAAAETARKQAEITKVAADAKKHVADQAWKKAERAKAREKERASHAKALPSPDMAPPAPEN
jgi:beta-lactamase regulating signal transducer with metallopeptidase domain